MNVGRSLRWHNARVNGARKIANLLWRLRYNGNEFSIISNNCWGGAIYQSLHRPYLSPFAGIFLMAPCYLRLLADLRHYLSRPPRQTTKSQYASVHRVYGPTPAITMARLPRLAWMALFCVLMYCNRSG